MNYPSLVLLCVLGYVPGLSLKAEVSVVTGETAEKERALLTSAQLDELLAPIALYPDPLVAIILPATTFPAEVVMAARYLKAGGDPDAVEDQAWDDSVKALARYPEVVKWMDENLAWTQQVGAAFLLQPAAVLTGTQRLRAVARAAGNLIDTPEQTVVVERETIRIVPARPEVIYVPVYDPVYVYRPRVVDVYYPRPLVTFSVGYRTGFWLSYHCNWGYNTVVVISRPHRVVAWQTYPRWSCPTPSVVYQHHVWRPAPIRVQAVRREYEHRSRVVVSRPSANVYVQHGPERDGRPRGGDFSPVADPRRDRPDGNLSGRRAVAPTGTPSPEKIAQRPTRSPEFNRPGQTSVTGPVTKGPTAAPVTRRENRVESTRAPNPGAPDVVSVSPTRGERENRRLQNESAAPAPRGVTRPAPTTVRPGTGPGALGRELSAAPRISGPASPRSVSGAGEFRTRHEAPGRVNAPARETTTTGAVPRREREERTVRPALSSERPSGRTSMGAGQAMPTQRMRGLGAADAPATTTEGETSRPRR